MAQGQAKPIGSRRAQDGSRWYNERPTPGKVASWFKENVPLDDGMDPARYIGGITLIEGWEHTEELRDGQSRGSKIAVKVRNRVATPYMRVDTRILYFWDWCSVQGVVGAINPVGQEEGMRPGFFLTKVKDTDFVGCSMQVVVSERAVRSDGKQVVVRKPPPATKLVPLLERKTWWENNQQKSALVPDPYAHMKAETGAIGRALGFAGMLVVPGTGVATAEDIQEMVDRQAAGGVLTGEDHAAAPSLPQVPDPSEDAGDAASGPESPGQPPEQPGGEPISEDERLREDAEHKLEVLRKHAPKAHAEFQRWAREDRKFTDLSQITPAQLRGVVRKLDKEITAHSLEETPVAA